MLVRPVTSILCVAMLATGAMAFDAGDLHNEWTTTLSLRPARGADGTVRAAVEQHVAALRSRTAGPGLAGWLADYRSVLERFTKLTDPRPVLTKTGLVSRWLVGVEIDQDRVGGFFSVGPDGKTVVGELSWSEDLTPLWTCPRATWDAAASANDIPALAELVTPSDTFTMGLPIEPGEHPDWTFVKGATDELPYKFQEERKEWLEKMNGKFRLERPLAATLGRRTGTSKCMSVAASYLADFWSVQCGRELPTYVNGVGGQKEYGANPRLLESIFYMRSASESSLFGMDFRTAPFSHDRVTGEPIPFSMRSYARILTETGKLDVPDHLVKSVVYHTGDNPFAMDGSPVYLFKRADYTDEALRKALDTWGPLLAQHTERGKSGEPKRFVGVHGVVIVGYGTLNGKSVFVYRESFGGNGKDYLEDSFGGPRLRVFPLQYLYQAIAFPHRLILGLSVQTAPAGTIRLTVDVTTNGGRAPVDPGALAITVDGRPSAAQPTRVQAGRYTVDVKAAPGAVLSVAASRKYFADAEGRTTFEQKITVPARGEARADGAGREQRGPGGAEEAVGGWAEEVAAQARDLYEQGQVAEARRMIDGARKQSPEARRTLTAKLVELYDGDPARVPAELSAGFEP